MRASMGGGTATVALPPPPRHYLLRRLARYRLSHHLSSYRKQKQLAKTNDAPKTFYESDSLLSFPSTSTASTPNDRVSIPIEKLFEDAQHSMRLDVSRRDPKDISTQIAAQFDLSDTLFIDLSTDNLTDLPEFVGRLTRLRTMIVSHNRLPSIALSAASLTYLDLSFNRISELSDMLISGVPQLRILFLAGNRIETLNPNVKRWAATLEELDLTSNLLATVPTQLSLLTNLRVLNISDNRISTLPPEIGEITSLALFDASRNRLERLPSSLWRLASNTLANVVLRVDDNPLVVPPLHVIRRGRHHIGKFLRELAINEPEANIEDIKSYDTEFYSSHGIRGTTKMRGYIAASPWNVPLSVNTQNASNAFAAGSTAPIGGTDSGYASTVDENRFSHEFAMANGLSEERRNSFDRTHSIPHRAAEDRMPAIPQLDLSAVESSEAPINRARNGDTCIKFPAQLRQKLVDSNNNNYSHTDNNNRSKLHCANDKAEKPKSVEKNVTTGTVPNTRSTISSASSAISRVAVSRSTNLLNGLQSSHGSTSVLSPLVERNESSWAAGETAPQQNAQVQNSTSAHVTTKPLAAMSTSNIPRDTGDVDNSTNVKTTKTVLTPSSSSEDKIVKRLPAVTPASATLPRKKIHETTQKNTFTVPLTSNSSEDLTKLTGKSTATNSKPLISASNSRLARSIPVKPVNGGFTTRSVESDTIRSMSTLLTKTLKSTAPSAVAAKASSVSRSIAVPGKSQSTDRPTDRITPTSAAKMARSVVAPTSMAKSAVPTPNKRPTAAPSPSSARSIRAGLTAPRGEKTSAQPLSQKSSSTLQPTRKVAPVTSTTSRLAAANATNVNLKRHN